MTQAKATERLAEATEGLEQMAAVQKRLKTNQEGILVNIEKHTQEFESVSNQISSLDEASERCHSGLQELSSNVTALTEHCETQFAASGSKGSVQAEQIEFLMQATEMIKRRLREMSKTQTGQCKELHEGQEGLLEKLSALERSLKQQERDVKSL